MWDFEFTIFINRTKDTIRKMDPIITCNPWNPVVIKKILPNEESDIQNGASTYSNPCNAVKITPKVIVMAKEITDLENFFFNISWWHQVTVTPEDRSRIVFIKGILIGLKVTMDKEGHICPNSIVGEILLWKNAQKKDAKNKTSDTINRIIPIFNPFITSEECIPWYDPSRWTSRHQRNATMNVKYDDASIIRVFTLFIIKIALKNIDNAVKDARIGHGLTFTKWKELNLVIIILLL